MARRNALAERDPWDLAPVVEIPTTTSLASMTEEGLLAQAEKHHALAAKVYGQAVPHMLISGLCFRELRAKVEAAGETSWTKWCEANGVCRRTSTRHTKIAERFISLLETGDTVSRALDRVVQELRVSGVGDLRPKALPAPPAPPAPPALPVPPPIDKDAAEDAEFRVLAEPSEEPSEPPERVRVLGERCDICLRRAATTIDEGSVAVCAQCARASATILANNLELERAGYPEAPLPPLVEPVPPAMPELEPEPGPEDTPEALAVEAAGEELEQVAGQLREHPLDVELTTKVVGLAMEVGADPLDHGLRRSQVHHAVVASSWRQLSEDLRAAGPRPGTSYPPRARKNTQELLGILSAVQSLAAAHVADDLGHERAEAMREAALDAIDRALDEARDR